MDVDARRIIVELPRPSPTFTYPVEHVHGIWPWISIIAALVGLAGGYAWGAFL